MVYWRNRTMLPWEAYAEIDRSLSTVALSIVQVEMVLSPELCVRAVSPAQKFASDTFQVVNVGLSWETRIFHKKPLINNSCRILTHVLYNIIIGFCHSPVDIRASGRAGMSADRRGIERENRQESDKHLVIFFMLVFFQHVKHLVIQSLSLPLYVNTEILCLCTLSDTYITILVNSLYRYSFRWYQLGGESYSEHLQKFPCREYAKA